MPDCKLIVDITLLKDDEMLLVRYKNKNKYDHQSGWFLPDDLLQELEHPDDAAKRIIFEQLGISLNEVKISFVESFIGNDKSWHIVLHYVTEIKGDVSAVPTIEIQEYKWFNIKDLPEKKDIAHQGWAKYTIEEILKNRIYYK